VLLEQYDSEISYVLLGTFTKNMSQVKKFCSNWMCILSSKHRAVIFQW